MPILTLQKSLVELGRIRTGRRDGKSRPEKLEAFRFTTPSEDRAAAVAELFGGDVRPWTPDGGAAQWEVISPVNAIPVVVPPGQAVTQWYELWSGGGCQRRCDGLRNVLRDVPCECPADPTERAQQAANGKACKPTTRVSVVLRDLPGVGVWRLESHGYYAATELAGSAEFLASASASGVPIPATLRLEQRSVKRDGQTRRYSVPVLDVSATPAALLSGSYGSPDAAVEAPARRELAAGESVARIAQHFADDASLAETLDALRVIYEEAAERRMLDVLVLAPDNSPTTLSHFLLELRKVLA